MQVLKNFIIYFARWDSYLIFILICMIDDIFVKYCRRVATVSKWFSFQPSLSICWECLGTAAKNPAGTAESLSSCHECGSSVHLSCVAHGADLAALIARGNRWLCEDCASCSACSQTREQVIVNLLLCIKYQTNLYLLSISELFVMLLWLW